MATNIPTLLDRVFEGRRDEMIPKAKNKDKPIAKEKAQPILDQATSSDLKLSSNGKYWIGKERLGPILGKSARAFPWAEIEVGQFFFIPGAKKISGITHWSNLLKRDFKSRHGEITTPNGEVLKGLKIYRLK